MFGDDLDAPLNVFSNTAPQDKGKDEGGISHSISQFEDEQSQNNEELSQPIQGALLSMLRGFMHSMDAQLERIHGSAIIMLDAGRGANHDEGSCDSSVFILSTFATQLTPGAPPIRLIPSSWAVLLQLTGDENTIPSTQDVHILMGMLRDEVSDHPTGRPSGWNELDVVGIEATYRTFTSMCQKTNLVMNVLLHYYEKDKDAFTTKLLISKPDKWNNYPRYKILSILLSMRKSDYVTQDSFRDRLDKLGVFDHSDVYNFLMESFLHQN